MSTDAPIEIRVGNTGVASAFTSGVVVVLIGLEVLLFVGAANSHIAGFFRVWFLALAVVLLAALTWFGLLLARNPRLISRTIVVDGQAVTMPARRFGAIPLHDVAGVGLVRLRNPRSGAPAGGWAVAVWRADASIAYAGGFQRAAQTADPTTSKAAGRHRRAQGRPRRNWLINAAAVGWTLDVVLTPMAGGAQKAPSLLFGLWCGLVLLRTDPRWRRRSAATCRWLSLFSLSMFTTTLKVAISAGAIVWLNSATLWLVLAATCGCTSWWLRERPNTRGRHTAVTVMRSNG